VVKIIEITELADGLTSFRTEVDAIDASLSLEDRYQRYKELLANESEANVADESSTTPDR
jgi:hypothetical protein